VLFLCSVLGNTLHLAQYVKTELPKFVLYIRRHTDILLTYYFITRICCIPLNLRSQTTEKGIPVKNSRQILARDLLSSGEEETNNWKESRQQPKTGEDIGDGGSSECWLYWIFSISNGSGEKENKREREREVGALFVEMLIRALSDEGW